MASLAAWVVAMLQWHAGNLPMMMVFIAVTLLIQGLAPDPAK